MIARDELHELVDLLAGQDVPAAQSYLRYLAELARDPLIRALADAPIDDEEETEEERAAVREAKEAIARGEFRPLEELSAELERRAREDEERIRKAS